MSRFVSDLGGPLVAGLGAMLVVFGIAVHICAELAVGLARVVFPRVSGDPTAAGVLIVAGLATVGLGIWLTVLAELHDQ